MKPPIGGLIYALFGLLAIVSATALGQSGSSSLKPGDIFPPLAGQPLASKGLTLPPPASGGPAVVIVSFSRAGGHDAQNWAEHLSKDSPSLPIYSAIFLESVPRLFRSLAVSAIRSGMPAVMQAKTLLVFAGQSEWKKRLQVTDEDHAVVVLLGPTGQIQSIISGPFSGALYQMIRDHVQTPPWDDAPRLLPDSSRRENMLHAPGILTGARVPSSVPRRISAFGRKGLLGYPRSPCEDLDSHQVPQCIRRYSTQAGQSCFRGV